MDDREWQEYPEETLDRWSDTDPVGTETESNVTLASVPGINEGQSSPDKDDSQSGRGQSLEVEVGDGLQLVPSTSGSESDSGDSEIKIIVEPKPIGVNDDEGNVSEAASIGSNSDNELEGSNSVTNPGRAIPSDEPESRMLTQEIQTDPYFSSSGGSTPQQVSPVPDLHALYRDILDLDALPVPDQEAHGFESWGNIVGVPSISQRSNPAISQSQSLPMFSPSHESEPEVEIDREP